MSTKPIFWEKVQNFNNYPGTITIITVRDTFLVRYFTRDHIRVVGFSNGKSERERKLQKNYLKARNSEKIPGKQMLSIFHYTGISILVLNIPGSGIDIR